MGTVTETVAITLGAILGTVAIAAVIVLAIDGRDTAQEVLQDWKKGSDSS